MNRLKELRLAKGWNMREAAAQIGMPYTTYVNYEKETNELNSKVAVRLATFYEVSVDYLIGLSDDPRTLQKKQSDEEALNVYLEMLRTRPELKVLLDTVKGATKEEVEANVQFIEALRKGKE